jgi:hypothetical protein
MEPALTDYETPTMNRVGFNQARSKANSLDQFNGGRLFGNEGIRSGFEQKSLAPYGANNATHARRRFEQ